MSDAAQGRLGMDAPARWIVAIATRRDRDSFVALFTAFAPKVKAYLMRRGLSEPVAEEICQDTLLSVWRKADQFDPRRATAHAWIFTISRNLWVDFLRRQHGMDPRWRDELPDRQLTPEDQLGVLELDAIVSTAIDGLPPEQALVLRLSFFDDYTHPQIADRLGLPLGTVKSRIRLATAHLRTLLHASV